MLDLLGYTLVEKIVEGAETTVYRGRLHDGIPVAVKATRSDLPPAMELCLA